MNLRSKRMREDAGQTPNMGSQSAKLRPMPGVWDLPDEVLLIVFRYLSVGELCGSIPLVCQRWRRVRSDPSLYPRLSFASRHPSTATVLRMVQSATWLRHLHLSDRDDTNEILRQVAANSRRLESLVVRRCRGSAVSRFVSAICLRRVLHNCERLRVFSLKETLCNGRSFYNAIGENVPQLTSINFGPSKFVTAQALLNVVKHCTSLEMLKAFDFRQNHANLQITDHVATAFATKFSATLTSVKIECSSCTDTSFLCLAACPHLRKLRLDSAHNLTDLGAASFGRMPSLLDLSISYTYLTTADGWSSMLAGPCAARITNLYLGVCEGVNDEVCAVVSKRLVALEVLWLLAAGEGHITEQGYQKLLDELPAGCKSVVSTDGVNLRFHN